MGFWTVMGFWRDDKASASWVFGGVNLSTLENYETACNTINANSERITNLDSKVDKNINESTVIHENHYEALNAVCNATLVNITEIASNATKINTAIASLNDYIAKTDAIIKNHYEALLILCQKHGMVDSNTGDGDKVSPK